MASKSPATPDLGHRSMGIGAAEADAELIKLAANSEAAAEAHSSTPAALTSAQRVPAEANPCSD
jgi:hypothetical protein